ASEDFEDGFRLRLKLFVAIQVDHIIEIARACALAQRAHLLAEDFLIGVAKRADPAFGFIRERMHDGPLHRRHGENFVGREIEFNARQIAATRRNRAEIINPAFACKALSLVLVNVEPKLRCRNFKAGLLVYPSRDIRECFGQERLIEMSLVRDGEVEVFRKTIRLEVTLLQARAALNTQSLPSAALARIPVSSQPSA